MTKRQQTSEQLERINVGCRIQINHLFGEDTRYDGKMGIVTYIDSLGQIHGTWGGLAVIPGVDDYQVFID